MSGEAGGSGRNGLLETLRMALAAPLAAVGFLTVVPIPGAGAAAMGWAVACFPLAGAAIGALLAWLDLLLSTALPPAVVAALLLVVLLAVTGALHLDGLMDSFDGLFGGRDPAGRLAIMRDSRVGSYGIAAGFSLLLLEYGCLISLPAGVRGIALLVSVAFSRWAMASALAGFPAARRNGGADGSSKGLAAGLKPEVGYPQLALGTAFATGIAIGVAGWAGLGMEALAGATVVLSGRFATARLGGVTGDICGGVGQLVEAVTLLAAVAVMAGR